MSWILRFFEARDTNVVLRGSESRRAFGLDAARVLRRGAGGLRTAGVFGSTESLPTRRVGGEDWRFSEPFGVMGAEELSRGLEGAESPG